MDDKPAGLIYLASPYNSSFPFVRERRFQDVCSVAATLMSRGVHLFCPIAHTHPIAQKDNLSPGWKYWQEFDRLMLSHCSALWIVMLDGWKESEGIKGEIQIAKEMGIEIWLVDPTTCDIVSTFLVESWS